MILGFLSAEIENGYIFQARNVNHDVNQIKKAPTFLV
jgi:hypothetical protein